jgi:hypothetical protein
VVARKKNARPQRKGAIAVQTAAMGVLLMGMTALAIDVGYIAMTKAQLQAAADAATLSGGTALLAGLGDQPQHEQAVAAAGRFVAVYYAFRNRNGDLPASYAHSQRDVGFGWTRWNPATGEWEKHWSLGFGWEELPAGIGFNMIGVTLHRDVVGSSRGDRPLPLLFAQAIGHSSSKLRASATAVILAARGFRIAPGSDEIANVCPLVLHVDLWEKYLRACKHFRAIRGFPSPVNAANDAVTGEPLFGHDIVNESGELVFVQDFLDDFSGGSALQRPVTPFGPGPDGQLELELYPRDLYLADRLGTVLLGTHSTPGVARQIVEGVNADDLADFPHHEFDLAATSVISGSSSVHASYEDELNQIAGQSRVILLYDTVANPGEHATFTLAGLAAVRIVDVDLTGAHGPARLRVQYCETTLVGAIADIENGIQDNTNVFTPLMLIQ